MVSHVVAHDGDVLAFGKTCAGEVQRFVKTMVPQRAKLCQPLEVVACGPGVDHAGQARGVGRDHEVFRQAALEPQARDPEI